MSSNSASREITMDHRQHSESTAWQEISDIAQHLEATLTMSGGNQDSPVPQTGPEAHPWSEDEDNDIVEASSSLSDCSCVESSTHHTNTGEGTEHKRLDITDIRTSSIRHTPCYLLERIPGELRTAIYEHVLLKPSATIIVDTRNEIDNTTHNATPWFSLLLTCKQIHEECGKFRFALNKVHIFVPIFPGASNGAQDGRERRDLIASRLQYIADSQATARQLSDTRIFLGYLPRLFKLRWTEFFSSWMSVRDAIVRLAGICSRLEVSFKIHLANGGVAQHKFIVGPTEDGRERFELLLLDGSIAQTSDLENERLRRIKATIIKTMASCTTTSASSIHLQQ